MLTVLTSAHRNGRVFRRGKVPPIEIHRRMQAVYGDQCADVSTVRRWVRRFKDGERGQANLSDKTRSGRISKTNAALAEVY